MTARRRPRGRPAQYHHPLAREALLDAAVALFAEQGVAATTSAQIAARAGVTPALVHYYFRPRACLLDAVVDERLAGFGAHVLARLPSANASAAETVHALVDAVFDAAQRMPWLPAIWIREIGAGDATLRARMLRHLPLPVTTALVKRLTAARRRGEISAAIEPRFALLWIAGSTMFALGTQPLWTQLGGGHPLSVARLRRHVHALLASGLTGVPAPSRRTP